VLNLDEHAEVNAKVADFGLSRQASPKLGELLKTWQWLAPEVIDVYNSSGYDEMADVYSFGMVCWELATSMSQAPFEEFAEKEKTLQNKIITEGLRPTIPHSCPQEFAELISKCWQTNPKKRPNFEEIVNQLTGLLGLPSEMDDSL
jgi:serine/threonine protein kinase